MDEDREDGRGICISKVAEREEIEFATEFVLARWESSTTTRSKSDTPGTASSEAKEPNTHTRGLSEASPGQDSVTITWMASTSLFRNGYIFFKAISLSVEGEILHNKKKTPNRTCVFSSQSAHARPKRSSSS